MKIKSEKDYIKKLLK